MENQCVYCNIVNDFYVNTTRDLDLLADDYTNKGEACTEPTFCKTWILVPKTQKMSTMKHHSKGIISKVCLSRTPKWNATRSAC